MKGRKVVGLDVNGWRDHIARNWITNPGEEELIEGVHLGSAGPLSSVVRVGDEGTGRWIGGFPADLAPHGRGQSWGGIGDESLRIPVRDLIEGKAGEPSQLAAAFTDLARGAIHTVLAIEDSPETTETMQERLLAGMAEGRMRNATLVWRTVLAVLYAIKDGLIDGECQVGIVSHVSAGLSVQKLRVRRAEGHPDVLAPERSWHASLYAEPLGLHELVVQMRRRAVGDEGYSGRTAHRALARSVGRRAFGLSPQREVVRIWNGDWEEIRLDESPPLPPQDLRPVSSLLEGCDLVFLETITEGQVRARFVDRLSHVGLNHVVALPPDAVARGALVAGQRMSEGKPVYFDFLPRISTIVVGQGTARNYDLINEIETLEAGRIYRSPQPAMLAIPAGFDEIPIYLRKDAAPHPRKAIVTLDSPLEEATPVSVWVEQKPAAGRARIVMEAPRLGRTFSIDWDGAEEDEREWDDIIAELETPAPAIPDRLVLKSGLRPWQDAPRSSGMLTLLNETERKGRYDWDILANKATARLNEEYCVSSDGALPHGLPDVAVRQLEATVQEAVAINRVRLAMPGLVNHDNHALRFLTWQFRRCPAEVSEWLADCIENHAGRTGTHPFVWHPSNWVLIYQGVARTAQNIALEERVLRAVLQRDPKTWRNREESACVALMLSRSQTAPELLVRDDVERIGQRAIFEFQNSLGSKYTTFIYTPFLVGGLLRWRMREPRALLIGCDPLADDLAQNIEATRADLKSRHAEQNVAQHRREKYLYILEGLLDYLHGDQGNPNLLLDIYDAQ